MDKWADYGISAVHYNQEHTHIERVKVHRDNGDTIGEPVDYSRQQVIDAIKRKVTFVTIFRASSGGWSKGQPVFSIIVNRKEFIKTVENDKEEDNLENLPEY